ncbi:mannosyl-3-phosphoglycerate synthase [Ampelomyces quisqualis]|uniref:Mannosyl-3-phosphoglycerate synthase n=1 Tax=Ampelomyces quisqualis TaxID=50730 RepID=A0A6A5QTZ6_AMPQU|nr:mannosyl-3-phosphoglycerate synthase [Ampelomyces quisqualis]
MRLSTTLASTRVGDVHIHETFQVIELDAGHQVEETKLSSAAVDGSYTVPFSHQAIHAIEKELAIIVPCKDEDVSILDGVLHGIPHDCLIILLSNSKPGNYAAERAHLMDYCTASQRSSIAAHQHDAGIAQAFIAAGMPQIVTDNRHTPHIRNGKGEAMIIGVVLAKLVGKRFVGFVDADNLVAGSVHEYCKVYAAGLHYALHCDKQDDGVRAMVRIKWNSKPKVQDGEIVFEKSGRSSRVVNHWMNRLLNVLDNHCGQTDMIQTGNAGEHAMSIDYALELKFATGYAVEPYQLIDTWERLAGSVAIDNPRVAEPRHTLALNYTLKAADLDNEAHNSSDESTAADSSPPSTTSTPASSRRPSLLPCPSPCPPAPSRKVRILQIQTRNPHFHDTGKGADHISKMQAEGLSTIYHSRFAPETLKSELRHYVQANLAGVAGVSEDGELAVPRIYPAIGTLDFAVFRSVLKARSVALQIVGEDAGAVLL